MQWSSKKKVEIKGKICATVTTNALIANREVSWCVKVLAVCKETSRAVQRHREEGGMERTRGTRVG